jgi:DNA-binding response OmpR family regulator
MADPLRILIVDDDPTELSLRERSLRLDGFEVTTTSEVIGVSAIVRRLQPNIVLFDVNMNALSGDRLLEVVRRYAPADTKLVLFSACDQSELRRRAATVKADAWISKSTMGSELSDRIRSLCR